MAASKKKFTCLDMDKIIDTIIRRTITIQQYSGKMCVPEGIIIDGNLPFYAEHYNVQNYNENKKELNYVVRFDNSTDDIHIRVNKNIFNSKDSVGKTPVEIINDAFDSALMMNITKVHS